MQLNQNRRPLPWPCAQRDRFLAFGKVLTALLLSVSVLSACGFHLKGMGSAAQATYQTVRLIDLNKVSPDVVRALKQQLTSMGVEIVENLADAELAITFQATAFQSSSTGKTGQGDVSSELLKMSQPMVVDKVASGEKLLATTVTVFRDRNVDNAQLQAASRELRSIKKQMAIEVALQVIDRANRVYAKEGAKQSVNQTDKPTVSAKP